MSKISLGIDFGTSYSNVSFRYDNGTLKCLTDENSEGIFPGIPTVVCIYKGKFFYGEKAILTKEQNPEAICLDTIKTKMRAKNDDELNFFNSGKSLYEIIESYLEFLIDFAIEKKASIDTFEHITIGCPYCCYGDYKAKLEQMILKIVHKKEILLSQSDISVQIEPSLAALNFICKNPQRISNGTGIAVFDMGGGTTDFSIAYLDRTGEQIEIIDESESSGKGGISFDQALFYYISDKVTNLTGQFENRKYNERKIIETAKIELFKGTPNYQFYIDGSTIISNPNSNCQSIMLTSAEFNSIQSIITILEMVTQDFINFIRESPYKSKVKYIIMTGGSSQINCLKELLLKKIEELKWDIEILTDNSCFSTAISNGAAQYNNNSHQYKIKHRMFNHSYGTDYHANPQTLFNDINNSLFDIATIIAKSNIVLQLPYMQKREFIIEGNIFPLRVLEYDDERRDIVQSEWKNLLYDGKLRQLGNYTFNVQSPGEYILVYIVDEDISFLDIFVFKKNNYCNECVQVIFHTKNVTEILKENENLNNITLEILEEIVNNREYSAYIGKLINSNTSYVQHAIESHHPIHNQTSEIELGGYPENLLNKCGHDVSRILTIVDKTTISDVDGNYEICQIMDKETGKLQKGFYAVKLRENDKPDSKKGSFPVKKAMFGLSSKWKIV